jgi:hypothetical protein
MLDLLLVVYPISAVARTSPSSSDQAASPDGNACLLFGLLF